MPGKQIHLAAKSDGFSAAGAIMFVLCSRTVSFCPSFLVVVSGGGRPGGWVVGVFSGDEEQGPAAVRNECPLAFGGSVVASAFVVCPCRFVSSAFLLVLVSVCCWCCRC